MESVGKADLLSDHFDSKQSREAVDLPLTCHPSPSLTTFAFRSGEIRRLLLDLDPYGGNDTFGMFPLFLKRTADVMAPRHSVLFRQLVIPKESDDLVILGVTFESKMNFEKPLLSVSRAASQRLGILRKSLRMFHDR